MGIIDHLFERAYINRYYDFSHLPKKPTFEQKVALAKKFDAIYEMLIKDVSKKDNDPLYKDKRAKAEEIILGQFVAYPDLMRMTCNPGVKEFGDWGSIIDRESLVIKAALKGYRRITDLAMKDEVARRLQDYKGQNLGMVCVCGGWEDLAIEALKDPIASIQQDNKGCNIGMYCAGHNMYKATRIALDNPVASTQQDNSGMNIGMRVAFYGGGRFPSAESVNLVLKAAKNNIARKQLSINGNNMYNLQTSRFAVDQCGYRKSFVEQYEKILSQNEVEQFAEQFLAELGE